MRFTEAIDSMVEQTVTYLSASGVDASSTGMILGTGFGSLVDSIQKYSIMPYSSIPGFHISTAPEHAGNLIYGCFGAHKLLIMQGRFHRYEGYTGEQVTFPVAVMRHLGVSTLILTNAAGAINPFFHVGDLMLIEDHLHFMGGVHRLTPSAWTGPGACYDAGLRHAALRIAERQGLTLRRGVLAWMNGPSFETRAEIETLRRFGADAVTMSTIPEAIAGRALGMRVLGFSCVSNLSTGMASGALHADDVLAVMAASVAPFVELMRALFCSSTYTLER